MYEWAVGGLDKSKQHKVVSDPGSFRMAGNCDEQQVAGGIKGDSRLIELGKTQGNFQIEFGTFDVPDRIWVTYRDPNGSQVWKAVSTHSGSPNQDGCVSTGSVSSNESKVEMSNPISFQGSKRS